MNWNKIGNIKGPKGKDGISVNGIDGKDGAPGKDGRDGKDGKPGKDAENKSVVHKVKLMPKADFGADGDWAFNEAGELFFKDKNKWSFFGMLDSRVQRQAKARTTSVETTYNTLVGQTVQDVLDRLYGATESQKPTYNTDGTLNYLEYFSSSTQETANRIARVDMTYNTSLEPTTEVLKLYSKLDGSTILKTVTTSYTFVNNVLTNKTRVTV